MSLKSKLYMFEINFIIIDDLFKTLKLFQRNKCQGIDGIAAEFYC